MPLNPSAYELRGYDARPPPSRWRWFLPFVVLVVVAAAIVFWMVQKNRSRPGQESKPAVERQQNSAKVPRAPPKEYWPKFIYPTALTNLLNAPPAESFQDTGAGNPQSGMFGTVRTGESGLGQFHEGLDIRSASRDRRGRPLDEVYAVANGRVAYANRIAGNSNYGKYIVLMHDDPVGEVFTLYAHLADIEGKVRPGATIAAGEHIGLMGNTSSGGIPMERAHLHFEIGVMVNARFGEWYRAKRQIPDHGAWHGYNLLGFDPLAAFRVARETGRMDFGRLIAATPAAFSIAVRSSQLPDFFRRYPSLWQGAPFDGNALVISANENGAPLSGRNATAAEKTTLGKSAAIVLEADAETLGRNGRRIVQQSAGSWRVGSNGREWLEILLYPERVR